MSTISSALSTAFTSPKQRILDSISNQVSLGTISSTDQTALDSAVDSIDGSLQSDRTSSSQRLAPSEMKSRVDDLIAQQVSSGALTSDQADTLKQVFAQGHSGHGGHGGVAGAGGPPPGPPPSDDGTGASDDSSTSLTSAADATASSGTGSSASDLLSSFIKQLQASQSQTSSYGSGGTSGSGRLVSALLLNFEA